MEWIKETNDTLYYIDSAVVSLLGHIKISFRHGTIVNNISGDVK